MNNILSTIALILCIATPSMSKEHPKATRYEISGYALDVPDSVKCDQHDMEDFTVLHCKRDARTLISMYLGNAPDFRDNQKTKDDVIVIGQWKGTKRRSAGKSGERIDILLKLKANGWPTFAHFFYDSPRNGDRKLADAIINSFRSAPDPKGAKPI